MYNISNGRYNILQNVRAVWKCFYVFWNAVSVLPRMHSIKKTPSDPNANDVT